MRKDFRSKAAATAASSANRYHCHCRQLLVCFDGHNCEGFCGLCRAEIPRLPSIPSVVVRAEQTKTKRLLWWQTNVKYWRYNFFSYPSGDEHKKVDVSLRDVVRDFYSILRPIVCRDDFFVGNSALRWGRCCVCYPDKGCERGSVPAGYGKALLKLRLTTKNIAILQKKESLSIAERLFAIHQFSITFCGSQNKKKDSDILKLIFSGENVTHF